MKFFCAFLWGSIDYSEYSVYNCIYTILEEGDILKILISNKSELPIYEQIKVQIREQIMSGEIAANESLPSIRKLAKELGISVITTTRAYSDLEKEGFLITLQGKGTFVVEKDNHMIKEQFLKRIEQSFMEAINNAKLADVSNEEMLIILKNLMEE